MSRLVNLTPALLRKIVLEEKAKLMRESTSDPIASGKEHASDLTVPEVDADDFADTLEKQIDYMKALKIHEARLTAKLKRIQEAKRRMRARVNKQLG